jgi:hypothetical protein
MASGLIDRAVLMDAPRLRRLESLRLSLPTEVRLELGEHAQHVQERLARGRRSADRLLGRLERDAFGPRSRTTTSTM